MRQLMTDVSILSTAVVLHVSNMSPAMAASPSYFFYLSICRSIYRSILGQNRPS